MSSRLPTAQRPDLSVVVPVYNEEDSLEALITEIGAALGDPARPYEIVVVDDGSTDGSLATLKHLKRHHSELHIVTLATNAGQTAALAAGFRAARGRVVITLDADLQNDPGDIPALVSSLEAGTAAAVVGYRLGRRDSAWKRVQSGVANLVRNWLTGESIRDTGCGLKAFRADVLGPLPPYDGMHRFLPTLIKLGGGTVLELPVRHRARRFGVSKYGMWKRAWRGLVDAMVVRWMQERRLRYQVREDLP